MTARARAVHRMDQSSAIERTRDIRTAPARDNRFREVHDFSKLRRAILLDGPRNRRIAAVRTPQQQPLKQ